MKTKISLVLLLVLFCVAPLAAQDQDSVVSKTNYKALKLRNIGPAFTSGRIADVAIHPDNNSVWYVAVGSGGVRITKHAGTTWK